MRNKIFMYLFIFAALYIVFQYMNAKKANEFYEDKVSHLETEVNALQAENESLHSENLDLNYFSLMENDDAVSYFAEKGFNAAEIAEKVKGAIIDRNQPDADNELVPFAGMEGKMRINHIKILNNHWIIADFTDGVYWGEVLLDYTVDENGNLSISTIDGFLYSRRN
ncbi:MAG TPA: hypothetical protein VFM82_10895 [Flavobacteriaceae bacterium]|nr:hypothetical protein [Flavobacteriaceae bacterium]